MLGRISSSSCRNCISNQLHSLNSGSSNNISHRVILSTINFSNTINHRSLSTVNESPTNTADVPPPSRSSTSSTQIPKTTLSYSVSRTKSNQLPVYETSKRGGNLPITTIAHVEGNMQKLSEELQTHLNVSNAAVTLKFETKKINIRGQHKDLIKNFLEGKKL